MQNNRPADESPIREGMVRTSRHSTHFLEAGPSHGRGVILIHGWPEIGLAWRAQLLALGALGLRVIAPDLRGCGQSMVHRTHDAYSQREIVKDMLELVDCLGLNRAIWIGHDWGSAVAWNVASHHPERCVGVGSLCVPYWTLERGLDEVLNLLNRTIYPAADFPAAQFEYIRFYHDNFNRATTAFEADVSATFRALMRRGDPALRGQPFVTAYVRKQGGWFGPDQPAPNAPLDEAILSRRDLDAYIEAYKRTGFFGINSLYMNDSDNRAYSDEAPNEGRLDMPVLFLSGAYDYVSDTENSDLQAPMLARCANVERHTIACGHWMQHEASTAVNAVLGCWIESRFSTVSG